MKVKYKNDDIMSSTLFQNGVYSDSPWYTALPSETIAEAVEEAHHYLDIQPEGDTSEVVIFVPMIIISKSSTIVLGADDYDLEKLVGEAIDLTTEL